MEKSPRLTPEIPSVEGSETGKDKKDSKSSRRRFGERVIFPPDKLERAKEIAQAVDKSSVFGELMQPKKVEEKPDTIFAAAKTENEKPLRESGVAPEAHEAEKAEKPLIEEDESKLTPEGKLAALGQLSEQRRTEVAAEHAQAEPGSEAFAEADGSEKFLDEVDARLQNHAEGATEAEIMEDAQRAAENALLFKPGEVVDLHPEAADEQAEPTAERSHEQAETEPAETVEQEPHEASFTGATSPETESTAAPETDQPAAAAQAHPSEETITASVPPLGPEANPIFASMPPAAEQEPGYAQPTVVQTERRPGYQPDYQEPNGVGAGLVVGYLIGRHKWKKRFNKVSKQMEQVKHKLTGEVTHIDTKLRERDAQVRSVAVEQLRLRQAQSRTEQQLREQTQRAAQGVTRPVVPERSRFSEMIHRRTEAPIAAAAIGSAELLRNQVIKPIERPKGNADTMPRAELLAASTQIEVEGTTLKNIYEAKLISEQGLRNVINTYERGGDVKRVLQQEIVEQQREFERDPHLRHADVTDGGGVVGGGTVAGSILAGAQDGSTSNAGAGYGQGNFAASSTTDEPQDVRKPAQIDKGVVVGSGLLFIIVLIIIVLLINY